MQDWQVLEAALQEAEVAGVAAELLECLGSSSHPRWFFVSDAGEETGGALYHHTFRVQFERQGLLSGQHE